MHVEQPKNMKNQKKKCIDIQARGPRKREAAGICPVCQMVNSALIWQC